VIASTAMVPFEGHFKKSSHIPRIIIMAFCLTTLDSTRKHHGRSREQLHHAVPFLSNPLLVGDPTDGSNGQLHFLDRQIRTITVENIVGRQHELN